MIHDIRVAKEAKMRNHKKIKGRNHVCLTLLHPLLTEAWITCTPAAEQRSTLSPFHQTLKKLNRSGSLWSTRGPDRAFKTNELRIKLKKKSINHQKMNAKILERSLDNASPYLNLSVAGFLSHKSPTSHPFPVSRIRMFPNISVIVRKTVKYSVFMRLLKNILCVFHGHLYSLERWALMWLSASGQ